MNGMSHVDDLLATMQAFLAQLMSGQLQLDPFSALADPEHFHSRFLGESYLVLEFPIDYATEAQPSQGLQNPVYYRFISTQAALAYAGKDRHTTLSGVVARIILNMRYVAMAFGTAIGKPNENKLRHPGKQSVPDGCQRAGRNIHGTQ